jgi:hypothetical protein
MAKNQVWFSIGEENVTAFQRWCAENGYAPARVFVAGLRLISTMPHEDRKKYFTEADKWKDDGFPGLNEPESSQRSAKKAAPRTTASGRSGRHTERTNAKT